MKEGVPAGRLSCRRDDPEAGCRGGRAWQVNARRRRDLVVPRFGSVWPMARGRASRCRFDQAFARSSPLAVSSPPRASPVTECSPSLRWRRTASFETVARLRASSSATRRSASRAASNNPNPNPSADRVGRERRPSLYAEGPLLRASGIRRSGGYFMAGGRLSDRRSHPLGAVAI